MTGCWGFYASRTNFFLRPGEIMNGEKCFWYMHNNWYKYCIQHQNPQYYNLFTKGPLNPVLCDPYCRQLHKCHKVKEHKYYSISSTFKLVFSCFLGASSSAIMIALCVCAPVCFANHTSEIKMPQFLQLCFHCTVKH